MLLVFVSFTLPKASIFVSINPSHPQLRLVLDVAVAYPCPDLLSKTLNFLISFFVPSYFSLSFCVPAA